MSQQEKKDLTLPELSSKIRKTLKILEKQLSKLAKMRKVPDSEMKFMNKMERPIHEIRYKILQIENQIKIQDKQTPAQTSAHSSATEPNVATTEPNVAATEPNVAETESTEQPISEREPSAEISSQLINEISYENTLWSGNIKRAHCKWVVSLMAGDVIGYEQRNWCTEPFPSENKTDEQWYLSFDFKIENNERFFRFEVMHVEEPENDYEITAMMIIPTFDYTKSFSFRNSTASSFDFYSQWHKLPECHLTEKEVEIHCFISEIQSNKGGPLTSNVLSTMASILDDSLYTDMIVRTDGQDFACHKSVLAAASPVFKAMLVNKMKESIENVVDLTGVLDQIEVQDMLNFIYKETVPNNEERVTQLYNTAEMYDLANYKLIKFGNIIDNVLIQLERDIAYDEYGHYKECDFYQDLELGYNIEDFYDDSENSDDYECDEDYEYYEDSEDFDPDQL